LSLVICHLLDLIVSGKTRLRVLLKFFLVPGGQGHLRGIAEEFGGSTNAIANILRKHVGIYRGIRYTIMSRKEALEWIDGRGDGWKIWGK
jgi:hypothetical protein